MHGIRAALAALLWLLAGGAGADQPTDRELALEDKVHELEGTLGVVVDELARMRTATAVPEEPELESVYGLGPAASRIYGVARGLSIGGYAEGVYRRRHGAAAGDGDDLADFTRMVLYVGHKFTDRLVFNTELEWEHASTEDAGAVSVEFASLDYLWYPGLNLRAGLLLVPMGFVNEVHEPPFYYGTQRPEVERRIIPSTWRENGAGFFGDVGENLSYRVYAVNSLNASGFDSFGLRGGRQDGSEALAEDIAVVARVDVDLLDGLRTGGSYYVGNSGHGQADAGTGLSLGNARTSIWEAHADYRRGPLHVRALWVEGRVGGAGQLNTALGLAANRGVASKMFGGYGEIGYDLMQLLAPGSEKSLDMFFRYEYLDTQNRLPNGFVRDRSRPQRLFTPGLHFRPHPNVVLKLDYRNIDTWGVDTGDEVSVGIGLVF